MIRSRVWSKVIAAGVLGGATLAGGLLMVGGTAVGSTVAYRMIQKDVTLAGGQTRNVDIPCPKGLNPVGGGAHYGTGEWGDVNPPYSQILSSDVDLSGRGWEVAIALGAAESRTSFTVNAICVSP
jgi:hypothetical protein